MNEAKIPDFDVIIDVRNCDEYDSGHYENAISIPHTEFLPPGPPQLPSLAFALRKISLPMTIFSCIVIMDTRARQVIELLGKIFKIKYASHRPIYKGTDSQSHVIRNKYF